MANVMGASMMDDIDEALDEACGNVGLSVGEGSCAVFGVKKVPAAEANPNSVTVSGDRAWRVHLRCCLPCPILAAI